MTIGNVIWIWGMSGSGKSTLGFRLARDLGYLCLDSDVVRVFLSTPKNFSDSGRIYYQEELRRHIKNLQWRGNNMVVASITPFQEMRNMNRVMLDNYIEVYLKCDFEKLVERDPKGLYKRALGGEITNFTGIDSRFEEPIIDNFGDNSSPDIIINTGVLTEDEAYQKLLLGLRNEDVDL